MRLGLINKKEGSEQTKTKVLKATFVPILNCGFVKRGNYPVVKRAR